MNDGFIGEAMEAITVNAFCKQLAWKGESRRPFRDGGVKSSVEAGKLREFWVRLLCPFDELKCQRNMKRREVEAALQLRQHGRCDALVSQQSGPSMHDAVSDGTRF